MSKPPKTNITLRLDADLLADIDAIAARRFGPNRTDLITEMLRFAMTALQARLQADQHFDEAMQAIESLLETDARDVTAAHAGATSPAANIKVLRATSP